MGNMHAADIRGIQEAIIALNDLSESDIVGIVEKFSIVDALTVTIFQTGGVTGTMALPAQVNDNNTGTYASADVAGEYLDIDLGAMYIITQYRQHGLATNNGTGVWVLQRKVGGVWVDIVTFNARPTSDWSSWVAIDACVTQYLRLKCTTVDGGDLVSYIAELEVKY